jgi:hypothetical protein
MKETCHHSGSGIFIIGKQAILILYNSQTNQKTPWGKVFVWL